MLAIQENSNFISNFQFPCYNCICRSRFRKIKQTKLFYHLFHDSVNKTAPDTPGLVTTIYFGNQSDLYYGI